MRFDNVDSYKVRALISTLFIVIGVTTFTYANWLQVKALVAQVLIEQAWEETLNTPDQYHTPWAWADFWPVAKLTVANNDPVYVLSSASGQALAFGPGHMRESIKPGQFGQVMIAGHKDSHFSFLESVQLGDSLQLEGSSNSVAYEITALNILDSSQNQLPIADNDELLLITCYPFNSLQMNGPLRLVVTANRI
jgi:sortase A